MYLTIINFLELNWMEQSIAELYGIIVEYETVDLFKIRIMILIYKK